MSLIGATATQTFAQTCQPAPVGLVSWWTAEGNALDSRSRNNGTLLGGTTFSAGQNGQAFSFDGVNNFVNVPDSASLDSWTTTATFEAWINPQPQLDSTGYIFARRNANLSEGFTVAVRNNGVGLSIDIILQTSTGLDGFLTPQLQRRFQHRRQRRLQRRLQCQPRR